MSAPRAILFATSQQLTQPEAILLEKSVVKYVSQSKFEDALNILNNNCISNFTLFLQKMIEEKKYKKDAWEGFVKFLLKQKSAKIIIEKIRKSLKVLLENREIVIGLVGTFLITDNEIERLNMIDLLTTAIYFGSIIVDVLDGVVSAESYCDIFIDLITQCCNKYNAYLLMLLQTLPEFTMVVEVAEVDKVMLQRLANIQRPKEFSVQVAQFMNGFGNIRYKGALSTCIQIAEKKQFLFNPIVINKEEEFDEYLQLLAETEGYLRERLLYVDTHWSCFDVYRDDENNLSVLVIDPCGIDHNYFSFFTKDLCEKIFDVFPNVLLYANKEQKLHAARGCSVMSIDDVVRLHTVDAYLPAYQTSIAPLHAYLKDIAKDLDEPVYVAPSCDPDSKNSSEEEDDNDKLFEIKCVNLPLSLLRNMQSRKLVNDIIPNREDENGLITRKSKRSQLGAARKYFSENQENIVKNKRAEKKLEFYGKKNIEYFFKLDAGLISKEKIQEDQDKFTLAGKRKRVEAEKAIVANEDDALEPAFKKQCTQ